MTRKHRRPPMGLMPRWQHEEQRLAAIKAAIIRYSNAGREIPMPWIEEYNELINRNAQRVLKLARKITDLGKKPIQE